MFVGRAFGLDLAVSRPLPGLVLADDGGASLLPRGRSVDVTIRLQEMPPASLIPHGSRGDWSVWYESKKTSEGDAPSVTAWRLRQDGAVRIRYRDGVEFWVDAAGSNVWALWPGSRTVEDAAVYLLGPVLGLVLRLRGRTSLHASVIVLDDYAVAFAGGSRAGKSTTAAAFAQRGHRVLSDDVAVLEQSAEGLLIQPAFPQLKLWPESVEALFGSADALPRLVPTDPVWDKRLFVLDVGSQWVEAALPLAAVYVLGDRVADAAAPLIEALSPGDAFVLLLANTYANYLADHRMRANEFQTLTDVVRHVPIRRVRPALGFDRIDEFICRIHDDFETCQAATPELEQVKERPWRVANH